MATIAFVFAGQGAQTPGMGQAWMDASPAAASVFTRAQTLRPGTMEQCFSGTKEMLAQTDITQPCLFCVDLAAAEALRESGVQPAMAAGFSLGEVPALAFTGLLSFEDAFALVCRRAEAMQACADATPGVMLAVLGLHVQTVEALCAEVRDAYPVNYNCPGQLVVAVTQAAQAPLRDAIKQAGGKAMPLAVSGAFHSPMMASAEAALLPYVSSLPQHEPVIPLYANRTGLPFTRPFGTLIAEQVSHPVRWEDTIRNMAAAGADTFIEVGIGKALSGMIRKILPDAAVLQVQDPQTLASALDALKGGQ